MKLFIIGNGFDLAHGLKTSFYDFRSFLLNAHPDFLSQFEDNYYYPYDEDNKKLKLPTSKVGMNIENAIV